MKVFVAGASGAIGRPLVPRLLAAGHEVTGSTRSPERADAIRALGAEAVTIDVFDAGALGAVMAEAAPDVVVHELTALPERFEPRKKDLYDATNRVRHEGTRNLIEAARAAGARRFVCQSIAFGYAPRPGGPHEESDPLFREAPQPFGKAMLIVEDMERQALEAGGLDGLVLRYGWFYGPGTYYADDGAMAQDVRRRRFPVVGPGSGVFSFIHVDDAATATVAAVARGAPGVYNVVDDDPAPMREWLPAYAQAIGAKPPRRVPLWLARLIAGGFVATMSTTLGGASNAKAKRELEWQPRWASWRGGFGEGPR
ncbi:MAG: NAD(P)-dependent oxidoreductase [Actinomycetota bacterium]|nr:NAD(P)-dependent oxidoreductase [Actinomycetota bacterium]